MMRLVIVICVERGARIAIENLQEAVAIAQELQVW